MVLKESESLRTLNDQSSHELLPQANQLQSRLSNKFETAQNISTSNNRSRHSTPKRKVIIAHKRHSLPEGNDYSTFNADF